MIVAAALCPWPPLLVRELTGDDPVLPELRAACGTAVAALLAAGPERVAIVGPGPRTEPCPAGGCLDIAAFGGLPARPAPHPAPGIPATPAHQEPGTPATPAHQEPGTPATPAPREPAPASPRPHLPAAPGLGAYLLDRAGYTGPRVIWSVGEAEPPARCARLGQDLAAAPQRTALLVMGDGSARRSPKAPGHFDERAAAFDAAVERAVRAGHLAGLLALDPVLARDLMATGRPAWQVLAGALPAAAGTALSVNVQYAGDPFGVKYLVASLVPSLP